MNSTKFKVRGFHCDSYGHVNNARYLEFLEEARWEFLEPAQEARFFDEKNLIFLVVNINIDYKFPAVPNDILVVRSSIQEYGRKSLVVKQEIFNETKDCISASAAVKFVLFDTVENRSTSVTDEIKTLFDQMLEGNN